MGHRTPDARVIDSMIGLNLKAARKRANMSQEDLGKALGVSFQQIQKYEKGVNRIAGSRMTTLCDALKITPAYLLANTSADAKQPADPYDTACRAFAVKAGGELGAHFLNTLVGFPSASLNAVFDIVWAIASAAADKRKEAA